MFFLNPILLLAAPDAEVHASAEHSIANTVSHGCCRRDAMLFLGEKKSAILQSIVAE